MPISKNDIKSGRITAKWHSIKKGEENDRLHLLVSAWSDMAKSTEDIQILIIYGNMKASSTSNGSRTFFDNAAQWTRLSKCAVLLCKTMGPVEFPEKLTIKLWEATGAKLVDHFLVDIL